MTNFNFVGFGTYKCSKYNCFCFWSIASLSDFKIQHTGLEYYRISEFATSLVLFYPILPSRPPWLKVIFTRKYNRLKGKKIKKQSSTSLLFCHFYKCMFSFSIKKSDQCLSSQIKLQQSNTAPQHNISYDLQKELIFR